MTRNKVGVAAGVLLLSAAIAVSCNKSSTSETSGDVRDEAMQVGRSASSMPSADEDYFHDMDSGVQLTADEVRGRNNWIVWTGGNDRFWDYMANHTYGVFDLLKVLSSPPKFGYCTDDPSPAHHIGLAVRLLTPTTRERLTEIITALADRHAALRTAIVPDADDANARQRLAVPRRRPPRERRGGRRRRRGGPARWPRR